MPIFVSRAPVSALRSIGCALVVACIAAPVSATVTVSGVAPVTRIPPMQAALVRRGLHARGAHARFVTLADGVHQVDIAYPPGCTTNGPQSFVGEPGEIDGNTTPTNFAGGETQNPGTAGVVSGIFNQACDFGSFIGAGGPITIGGDDSAFTSAVGGGQANYIWKGMSAFIGAGEDNFVEAVAPYSVANYAAVVAGVNNVAGSPNDFIGAGVDNTVIGTVAEGPGQSAFVGAGLSNNVSGGFSAVIAGEYNTVTNDNGVVAGGARNTVSGFASFIGAGYKDRAAGGYAVAAGGYEDVANGSYSTVPGGKLNIAAGPNSFAAGTASYANDDGAFVWSDDAPGATQLVSSANNQFLARAAGGFYLYSSANLSSGVRLAPGSGSWSTLSDRAAKTSIADVDDARILAKIASLPVSEWSYRAEGTGVRHLGPMAQDFRSAFGLGEDARHISTVDEEGVALAAIKALQAEVVRKDQQLRELRRSEDRKFTALNDRLAMLERSVRPKK